MIVKIYIYGPTEYMIFSQQSVPNKQLANPVMTNEKGDILTNSI